MTNGASSEKKKTLVEKFDNKELYKKSLKYIIIWLFKEKKFPIV